MVGLYNVGDTERNCFAQISSQRPGTYCTVRDLVQPPVVGQDWKNIQFSTNIILSQVLLMNVARFSAITVQYRRLVASIHVTQSCAVPNKSSSHSSVKEKRPLKHFPSRIETSVSWLLLRTFQLWTKTLKFRKSKR